MNKPTPRQSPARERQAEKEIDAFLQKINALSTPNILTELREME